MFHSTESDIQKRNRNRSRNWETNIHYVSVQACDEAEDPLGFKAIFHMDDKEGESLGHKLFEVGASFLHPRRQNLEKAGFEAPMTEKAIALIEEQLGRALMPA